LIVPVPTAEAWTVVVTPLTVPDVVADGFVPDPVDVDDVVAAGGAATATV
jgi:hypothetical protein